MTSLSLLASRTVPIIVVFRIEKYSVNVPGHVPQFTLDLFVQKHTTQCTCFCLFDLILYVQVNNFQLCWDVSSWVETSTKQG